MLVLIKRASDILWFDFKSFDTVKDVFEYINEARHNLILKHNCECGESLETIMMLDNVDEKTAKLISECVYEIEIYDDYIE